MPNDPSKLFAVVTVSRMSIADQLNSAITELEDPAAIAPFTDDDSRLTDEVCQAIADSLWEVNASLPVELSCELEGEVYATALERWL